MSERIHAWVRGKSLVCKWERGGFARARWDLSCAAGIAYRLGFYVGWSEGR